MLLIYTSLVYHKRKARNDSQDETVQCLHFPRMPLALNEKQTLSFTTTLLFPYSGSRTLSLTVTLTGWISLTSWAQLLWLLAVFFLELFLGAWHHLRVQIQLPCFQPTLGQTAEEALLALTRVLIPLLGLCAPVAPAWRALASGQVGRLPSTFLSLSLFCFGGRGSRFDKIANREWDGCC